MRGPTLPFAPTKTYGPISINLRKKFLSLLFFFLSLSLLSSPRSLFVVSLSFLLNFLLFIFFLFPFLFFLFSFIFLVLSFPLFSPLHTKLNVSHSHKCTTCHDMCHPTPDASKNVKFRLSQNPTKFDGLTRFYEINSMVKSISSTEI